jgi:putative acetyltransferase
LENNNKQFIFVFLQTSSYIRWKIDYLKNRKRDNAAVAQLIRAVFDELNIPKVGTAYADPYLDLMFEEYNKPKSVYYVVENNGKVVGSAGVLENEAATICELQKMYFLPETRGLMEVK